MENNGKLIISAILSAFLLLGCGKGSDKKVKIAYLPITHAMVLHEMAKDKTLPFELVKYGSWPELLDALNTGRVDAASVLIEPAMKAKERGIGLTALALGHKDGNVIVVANTIEAAGDLRGKTIAIPHRASSHHILVRLLLEKEGISEQEISWTELPPPEMPSALASGRIAGYCVAEPFGAIAVNGGYGKVLADSHELWNNSICCALVANDRFLKDYPELASRLLSEYHAAGKRLADKENLLETAKSYLNQNEPVLRQSLEWVSFEDLKLTPEDYAKLSELTRKYGISEEPPKYEDFAGEQH